MEEPLLPKQDQLAAIGRKTPPFLTQVLVLMTLPTALAFVALSVLATMTFLQAVLGLGCMVLSGLAAVVIALGVFLVESRREALLESRYVVSVCVLSEVSESVLWVLVGMLASAEIIAPMMSVALGIQLILTLLSWQEALPAGSGMRLAGCIGVAQAALVLLSEPAGAGWIIAGSVCMIISNVFKAEKAQRLAVKRQGEAKEAALCALLLQHRNGKKLLRWFQTLLKRLQESRQE